MVGIKRYWKFVILFLIFSVTIIPNQDTLAQANLVEEENQFIIYSGNYFNLIVPKDVGPLIKFQVEDLGTIELNFNYLSEYSSPSKYMNSLTHLTGKGYSFSQLNWDLFGFAELDRAYINLTKGFLDRDSYLDFSINVFDDNESINGYTIQPLQSAYIELSVKNWTFSQDVTGLALNILSQILEPNSYERLGPYIDYEKDQFVVQLYGEYNIFELRFNSFIEMITADGEHDNYFAYAFTEGSISKKLTEPADFWISIPSDNSYKEMIFSFICEIHPNQNNNTSFHYIGSLITAVTIFVLIANKKRKDKHE